MKKESINHQWTNRIKQTCKNILGCWQTWILIMNNNNDVKFITKTDVKRVKIFQDKQWEQTKKKSI